KLELTCFCIHAKSSRHAKMHDERLSGIKFGEEIFRPAGKAIHIPTAQALGKVRRKGNTQVAAARFRARDPTMLQNVREAGAHGFDFGEFRHQRSGFWYRNWEG